MTEIKVYRVDTGSCNGCDIELLGLLVPKFQMDKLKLSIVDEPEEANALAVTGAVSGKSLEKVKAVYEKIQDPKIVVAVGACSISKGVFAEGYPLKGGIDQHLPVALYVSGCPPKPHAVARGLAETLGVELDHSGAFWNPPENARGRPVRDLEKCTACGACVNLCPSKALELIEEPEEKRKVVRLHLSRCIYCGTCEDVCPEDAVELSTDYRTYFADRESVVSDVPVAMASCSCCGEPFGTERQQKVVLERLKAVEAFKGHEKELEEWVSRCPKCAHDIPVEKKTKWAMFGISQSS